MPKAIYILIILFCTQLFVVGQNSKVNDLLDEAIDLAYDDPEKSIELTQDAFKIASRSNDKRGMVSSKSIMGYIGMVTNDYKTSYVNYTDALEYQEKYGIKDLYGEVSILNNLAVIKASFDDHAGAALLYKRAHDVAIQYVKENRELAIEEGDISWLIDLPYERAIELKYDGQYMEAGDILVELWEQSEFKKDTILLAKVVNQLGHLKKLNGEYAGALEFYAIAAFNENVDPSIRASALHNLASTYRDQEDYARAEKYYAQSYNLKVENSSSRSQFITLLDQGELSFVLGNLPNAIEKWEMALNTFDAIKNDPDLFIIHDWLQKAYLKTDVTRSAYHGDLYSASIKDWMTIQDEQRDNTPALQAFNAEIDAILTTRAIRAERIALLKRYWPIGVVVLLIIMLFIYVVQVNLNKRREQIMERNLKADRASVADEILSRIRRDN